MRVLLLMGVYRDDLERYPDEDPAPVVAGAIDQSVWDHESQQETERRWASMRTAFDPTDMEYEWREVWVEIDPAAVGPHFKPPIVAGTVESVATNQSERSE